MMKILTAATLTFLLSSTSLWAQTAQELAEQYVNMPEVQEMVDSMFSAESMAAQFAANLPPNMQVSEEQMQQVGAVLFESMSGLRPRVEELMILGSAKTFTTDELRALIDFYGSEHGAAIMIKMQPFMLSVMGELGPEMAQVQQDIAPKLIEILKGTE